MNNIDLEKFYALKEIEQAKYDTIRAIEREKDKERITYTSKIKNPYMSLVECIGYMYILLKFYQFFF